MKRKIFVMVLLTLAGLLMSYDGCTVAEMRDGGKLLILGKTVIAELPKGAEIVTTICPTDEETIEELKKLRSDHFFDLEYDYEDIQSFAKLFGEETSDENDIRNLAHFLIAKEVYRRISEGTEMNRFVDRFIDTLKRRYSFSGRFLNVLKLTPCELALLMTFPLLSDDSSMLWISPLVIYRQDDSIHFVGVVLPSKLIRVFYNVIKVLNIPQSDKEDLLRFISSELGASSEVVEKIASFVSSRKIKIGNVVIAVVPPEAKVIYISLEDKDRLEEIYRRYGRVPIFEGVGRTKEMAETDAMWKIAKYLNAVFETYRELAKASLSNIVGKKGGKQRNQIEVLETEVSKVVEKVMSIARITGAKELVVYVMPNGEYHVIYFFDPNSALKVLQEYQSDLVEIAKELGVDLNKLYRETYLNIEEAFEENIIREDEEGIPVTEAATEAIPVTEATTEQW